MSKSVTEVTIFGIGAGKDGQATTHFVGVTRFQKSAKGFEIDYVSASTSIPRTVTFFFDNISGYAVTETGY